MQYAVTDTDLQNRKVTMIRFEKGFVSLMVTRQPAQIQIPWKTHIAYPCRIWEKNYNFIRFTQF